ncbi:class I SAM-dependent methyltransferase [Paracoccus sp. 1_MG-2023]|uniref:class I SAM-dependent methyltransferase n=1 Tax=unclassified Paracoccus (in: a-proteobacteria) TaxID=2688777 RepID=UPI001C0A3ACD|nr:MULTISPECIES: class I SAM-dependent methyltransferase [unclassified Paracoccus (in: a-proteobacteria)]MBU2958463.1 class I SAM-dependent methyltransferase [Paracoccus sp. C2R09]MDO6668552.1 class I SAM-dependent methyltransferase [Paracoccus sp. 1_MG-2023]
MSFTAEWLALREPADRAARDAGLVARAALAAGPDPVILDLGSGTGSTLRVMEPHLPDHAAWRLVDNDADLLEQARSDAHGSVETRAMDLRDLDALPLEGVTLVTASALLDLMPADWIARLADRLAAARLPFYAALSYDGVMRWQPHLPGDASVTRAFNDHQRGDKGLGAALGPDSGPRSVEILRKAGFRVHHADSPWSLNGAEAPLHRALLEGIASAAAEAGNADAAEWGRNRIRIAEQSRCHVGHIDILALPPCAG